MISQRDVSSFFTPRTIIFISLENFSCHFQRVPPLHAPRQRPSPTARCDVSLRKVEGAVVKSRIVSGDNPHIIALDCLIQFLLDFAPCQHRALLRPNVLPVVRHFLGIVGTCHQFLVEKNVRVDITCFFIHISRKVEDVIAHIIAEWIVDVIGGFSINHYDTLVFINHFLVSFRLTASIIAQDRVNVKRVISKFCDYILLSRPGTLPH